MKIRLSLCNLVHPAECKHEILAHGIRQCTYCDYYYKCPYAKEYIFEAIKDLESETANENKTT